MWLTVANHILFIALNYYGLASFVSGCAEKGQNFLRTLYCSSVVRWPEIRHSEFTTQLDACGVKLY